MVMDSSHALHQASLHFGGADDLITLQKVLSYGHQRLFGPRLEPVYCAAANQARELHGSSTELLTNLQRRQIHFFFFFLFNVLIFLYGVGQAMSLSHCVSKTTNSLTSHQPAEKTITLLLLLLFF